MYRVDKLFYSGLGETKVRLTQDEPYRDFVVSLRGNLEEVENEEVLKRALEILALEFNPSFGLTELKKEVEEQKGLILDLQKRLDEKEEGENEEMTE